MSCERWFEMTYMLITLGGSAIVLLAIGINIGRKLK